MELDDSVAQPNSAFSKIKYLYNVRMIEANKNPDEDQDIAYKQFLISAESIAGAEQIALKFVNNPEWIVDAISRNSSTIVLT